MKDNPFKQAAHYTTLRVYGTPEALDRVQDELGDEALSSAAFEVEEDGAEWVLELLFDERFDSIAIEVTLSALSAANPELKRWQSEPLVVKDWAAEVQKQFPPLSVGRIRIAGSHLPKAPLPAIALTIDAGCAFGTGEHATTAACLEALLWLHKRKHIRRGIDVGTGTGILALAARRLWRAQMVGTDIDPVAVAVARDNMRRNQEPAISMIVADGLQHRALSRFRPADLVIANILANPLVAMADSLCRTVRPGGTIMLSGLLVRQELKVLLAYRARGMRLIHRVRRNGWSALVLQKP